jgi:tetratricopeptide (TPR) repeat protein
MIKKAFILLLIVAVVALATIPLWTQKMAEDAFNHPEKKNSPTRIKEAMLVKVRLQRYEHARELAEKAILYFPEAKEMPDFIYNAAKCAEQERKPYVAIFWYRQFLKKFPKHIWMQQAKNNLNKLKEMHSLN